VTANALEGKKIQLYIEHGVRNPSNGEMTDGIRIKDTVPKDGAKAHKAPKCAECGKEITGMAGYSAEDIARINKERYGKCLCIECGKKAKAALEAKTEEANGPVSDLAAELMADAEG
jgi:ribosomal protein L34E